jgi:hypothetical protein
VKTSKLAAIGAVLGEQVARLQTFIETGSPDAAKAKQ